MNKYRYVRYADDGCEEYQCLACKDRFVVRYASLNFCSHCGVKFEGQLECRRHDIPRWAFDRYGPEPPHDIRLYPEPRPDGPRKWIIEVRSRWSKSDGVWEEWGKWDYDSSIPLRHGYQYVKRWLDIQRSRRHDETDFLQTEFRATVA